MTDPTTSVPPAPARSGVVHRIRSKDPDLLVVKRSVRAAVVMPLVFALTHAAFSNPQVALFGAFGSFALLLLVEFTGRPPTRIASYGGLYVVGACFVVLGTFVSTNRVAAVVTMALVGFAVLFAGVVAPQAATATTAALLTFVLPVAVAQPASAIGPRLIGWTIAAVFCITACMWVWPPPWHDNLRRRLAAAISAVGRLADARSAGTDESAGVRGRDYRAATAQPAILRYALPSDRRRVGGSGALQAGGPGRMGCREHGHDRRRELVDGPAARPGCDRAGGRDTPSGSRTDLRR